jgi:hypothetical protein
VQQNILYAFCPIVSLTPFYIVKTLLFVPAVAELARVIELPGKEIAGEGFTLMTSKKDCPANTVTNVIKGTSNKCRTPVIGVINSRTCASTALRQNSFRYLPWYYHHHCCRSHCHHHLQNEQNRKLRGLSPRANYTDRATAACQ